MIRRLFTAGFIVAAVIAFYVIAPAPGERDFDRGSMFDREPEVAATIQELNGVRDTLRAVTFALQRSIAWELARALPDESTPTKLVVMPGIPADAARAFEVAVRAEFAAHPQPRVPLRVILASQDEAAAYRKSVVMPQTNEQACVVVISISTRNSRQRPYDSDRLLSTCGFFAKFGRPGSGMLTWLEATRGIAASNDSSPALDSTRPRVKLAGAAIGFSAAEAACLAGRNEGCEQSLLNPLGSWQARTVDTGAEDIRSVVTSFPNSGLYGPGNTLARIRAHVGDARFQEIWASSEEPAAAYETATGEHLAVFARSMLLLELRPHQPGPLRGGFTLLLGLAISVIASVWTIARARRERS